MLLYDNRERLRILLQCEGGVVWDSTGIGLPVGLATLGVAWWLRQPFYWTPVLTSTFSGNLVSVALTFALVFRTALAWQRYWEAADALDIMFHKWRDSCTFTLSFINTAERQLMCFPEASEERIRRTEELWRMRMCVVHDFSLLSALAVHRLTHGDIARMRRRSEKLPLRGAFCRVLCCCCRMRRYWEDLLVKSEVLRFDDQTHAFSLPHFRVIALEHERSDERALLRQATYSAFEKASSVGTLREMFSGLRSRSAKSASARRFSLRRSEISRKRTSANMTWSHDVAILGPMSDEERDTLHWCCHGQDGEPEQTDYVKILCTWLTEDFNELAPLTGIPESIFVRCYNELSNGMLGYAQAQHLADIPFPLPFTQLLEFLLVVCTLTMPFFVANFTRGMVSSPALAAVVAIALWSLHGISIELEAPFTEGPNEMPVVEMHEQFLDSVRELHTRWRPSRTLYDPCREI